MKYVKMLGLLAVAAAVLMALAGTASATVTSGGSAYTGEISATSTNSELDGTVDVKCSHSVVAGSTSKGATATSISTMGHTGCGSDTVSVIKKGTFTIHSNGAVTSNGAEVTAVVHRSVFGFPITTHCIYVTNNTHVGNLTEGTTTVNLTGANIPKAATDGACGENSQLTGTYTITKPGALTVD